MQAAAMNVEKLLGAAIRAMEYRLPEVVSKFKEEAFNPEMLETYLLKLCEFIDVELSQTLDQESASLGAIHDETKAAIIGEFLHSKI